MKNLKNNIWNSKTKCIFCLLVLFLIYISICAFSYANTVSNDISGSLFRLHVIANSDSIEDQNLKYIVRDKLIEYMDSITQGITFKEDAISIAIENKDEFSRIATNTIIENGYNYDVNVKIGNFSFPTKNYGDISLPAGNYDALRVEIGEAKGQNWWCVMFPPLCFVDISSGIVPDNSKQIIQDNLSDEEYNLISSKNNEMKFKFKILELFNNIDIFTAKK